ncbi:MAG TPA: acetate--CoA ligase [Euryarchaeota archaeon]|nr:acetyl-coenzyme A synthetase [archaeon BMS3Bbin15]HDL15383.1 acetate--CoA ligase [Euryarchaeota archaeon]
MAEKIESLLKEEEVYHSSDDFREKALVKDESIYSEDYKQFWKRAAEEVDWFEPYSKLMDDSEAPFFKWYIDGKINIAYNCLDRHVNSWRKNKAAILWEGENGDRMVLTYYQLYREVNRFANALKGLGVNKGDRVTIYLGMVPELPIAMLACAKIGAVHSIVFGGFSALALRERIEDSQSKIVITADGSYRRGKIVPLKDNVDESLEGIDGIEKVVVVKRTGNEINFIDGRDIWWNDFIEGQSIELEAENLDSEHPLFILYTSGTTGKPKGVVHVHGGYNVGTTITTKLIFDLKDEDVYWCTADIGWVTGHSYIIYGPLSLGATTLMYEGAPDYPSAGRWWDIIDRYGVSVFYTAPTAIRYFMRLGDEYIKKHSLSTLRLLGTVGEPINPEVWRWYYRTIGKENCPIVDTWWQTETGMILITTLPGVLPMKPGSAGKAFPGTEADIFNENGESVGLNEGGYLVLKKPYPSMLRTIYGDPDRYVNVYWSKFKGCYLTGDGARKDGDGYFWILGRIDDVLNVSGHRIGTMELESALVAHPQVAEAAVVGKPHEIKGQAIVAFVVMKAGVIPGDELREEIRDFMVKEIGSIAKPDEVHFVEKLPKTRSGKIMRRVIRAIAEGKIDVGDISTLEDESALDEIRKK